MTTYFNKPKQLIIIGSGPSLKEGIDKGLWEKLRGKYTYGINFIYQYFTPTVLTFVDWGFYMGVKAKIPNEQQAMQHREAIKKIPLIIGAYNENLKYKYKNTMLLRAYHTYYGRKSLIKNQIYKSNLTGLFSLTLGINLLDVGEIFLCYDKKTEVFTDSGWKYFKDLEGDELILTRKSNGNTEWSPILAQQSYYYKGNMFQIKNKGIDLKVTPDHVFCLETDVNYKNKIIIGSDGYIRQTIKEMTSANHFIPKYLNWKGNTQKVFVLPEYKKLYKQKNQKVVKASYKKEVAINMKSWCQFLGLYLSEGCSRRYETIIYQNHTPEKDKYIINILKKLPFKYKKCKRGWMIYDCQLSDYLKQFGLSDKKFIPKSIKNLNKKYLNFLLDSLIFGDGYTNKKRGTHSYWSISKQLVDDVQEIAYKCGYIASIYKHLPKKNKKPNTIQSKRTCWQVYFNNTKKQGNIRRISTRNLIFQNKIKTVNYEGMVYDITVNNHTLWVRRNNQCVWCGNCGFDGGAKQLFTEKKAHTHFCQSDPNAIAHDGYGKVGYYEIKGKTSRDYDVYKDEKDIKIYNVSMDSSISDKIITKCTYDQFFAKLDRHRYDQERLRGYIRGELNKKIPRHQIKYEVPTKGE